MAAGGSGRDRGSALGAAARGVVGAMAMTGMRRVSTGLGLLEKTPPRVLAEQAAPFRWLLRRLPPDRRTEAVELAHWAYGAAGGVGYALLVPPGRGGRWSGPAYGVAVWALFETAIVPLLGLRHARRRSVSSRLLLAADHALYGAVVGGSLAPATPPGGEEDTGARPAGREEPLRRA